MRGAAHFDGIDDVVRVPYYAGQSLDQLRGDNVEARVFKTVDSRTDFPLCKCIGLENNKGLFHKVPDIVF